MTSQPTRADRLGIEGPTAPPRRNGELVFDAPWESRVFGMTVALSEDGLYPWENFRAHLIAELARWQGQHRPDETFKYYERWLRAFEQLLLDQRLLSQGELNSRMHLTLEADHHA